MPEPATISFNQPLDPLRILSEGGEVDADLDPALKPSELIRLYRAMVLTRKLDMRMLNMQRQGRMGTFAPGIGQEATQIGQVYPLGAEDWFSPSYRSLGAQLWRGWGIEQLLTLWDGYFEGFAPPAGVNDLPFSIVIGSHVPVAVGVAMGIRYRGADAVMLTNFGDGSASQGPVAEALNFAAVYKSPVVFVCENNGYAISTPTTRQSAVEAIALRGVGYGIPAMRVDGNDILAMIVATTRAIQHARAGNGPYLIEALTYRMGPHTTADDPTVYRDDAETEKWKAGCPIARFERYLINKKVLKQDDPERINGECEQEVLDARDRFRKNARANPREVFDFIYQELTPELREQREEYLRKLDRKGIM